MNTTRSILRKYFDILEENGTAQYLVCKQIPVSFQTSESTDVLWKKHDVALEHKKVQNTTPDQSLLDLKIELARRIFHACCFCERRCGVDRRNTVGNCDVQDARIASEFLHFGEESVLVPSYTIFFSGCTFHCVFCQNWDISQRHCGVVVAPDSLVTAIMQRKQQGARNVNWVGGDPTSNLLFILEVLNVLAVNLPQVWNSNMYCTEETMRLLHGVMDVYLTDFKYGNDTCAQRLSKVENYTRVVQRNHVIAYRQGELIVRHLVMPNHGSCCSRPIIQWIKDHTPEVAVNVMMQYHPAYHAEEYEEIAHPLSREEYTDVVGYAETQSLHLI
jgi:putative pyruvate formate lyase activating enzyme